MKRVAFLVLAPLSIFAIASACTLRRPIATHAVAYNRSVEQAANRVLLLNIVRSMNRQPQYFTAITQVLGNATASLTPSLTIAESTHGGNDSITGALAGSFTHGQSTVTVGVLDTEEFTRAIMNPIDLSLLDYFMQQGWHEELLYILFIRQIDIKDDTFSDEHCKKSKTTVSVYSNHPGRPSEKEPPFQDFLCFRARLRDLIDHGNLRIELAPAAQVGFNLKTKDQDKLASLMLQADEAGLRIQSGPEDSQTSSDDEGTITYQIFRKARRKELVWDDRGGTTNSMRQAYGDEERLEATTEDKATVYFRSAQGILYYLGQVVRAQQELLGSTPPAPGELEPRFQTRAEKEKEVRSSEKQPSHLLFAAMLKDDLKHYPDASILLEARHDGKTYVIPELDPTDRSMSVLSIVSQLFDLNKKRQDLPGTGVVTVAGGS